MMFLVYTVHIVVCLFLIMVVLLQQGKGADLSVFGGGGTQAAFGARGATTLLHKLTVWGFVGFIVTTVTIGFLQNSGGSTVMSDVPEPAAATVEAEEATEAEPEAEAPATVDETAGEATPAPTDGEALPPETGEESGAAPSDDGAGNG